MTALPDPLVGLLDARIEARIESALVAARRPAFVHQRIVEMVTGLPADDFLEHGRDGAFTTWKVRRLVFARTDDVIAFIEAHPVTSHAANDSTPDVESQVLARVGARRVAR